MDAALEARPSRRRRRRPRPGWVPNQHGAWAMLVLPLAVGALRSGPGWMHLWLLLAWLLGYFTFFATGLWLRSGRKPRYRAPVVTYASVTAVVGGGLLAVQPGLLRWGVVYAPLLATSLWFSARRAERDLVNDVLTVAAASLMVVVAFGLRDDDAWLPGSGSASAWVLAAVVFGYFVGTALYVKTMIRERGNPAMYAASVGHHAAAALAALWLLPPVGLLAAVLALRAALVPRLRPGARPLTIGLGEIAASLTLGVLLVLVPLG